MNLFPFRGNLREVSEIIVSPDRLASHILKLIAMNLHGSYKNFTPIIKTNCPRQHITGGHFWPFSKLSKHSLVWCQIEGFRMRNIILIPLFQIKDRFGRNGLYIQICQNIVLFGVKLRVFSCRKQLLQQFLPQATLIFLHFGHTYYFMYYF